jgi:hypothetical protein
LECKMCIRQKSKAFSQPPAANRQLPTFSRQPQTVNPKADRSLRGKLAEHLILGDGIHFAGHV